MIDADEMTVRLSGTGLDDGEISFTGIAELAQAMQLLMTRIGRHLTGQDGPGRSPAVVERATELRLRGTAPGSTVLQVAVGDPGVLGEGLEHRSLDALLEIFDGIAGDEAPDWVTPLVGEATVEVLDALGTVSARCEVAAPSHRPTPITFSARTASRSVWGVTTFAPELRRDVSVSGRLDLVDLRRARFRVRDAAGNDVRLEQVSRAGDAARLAGEVVTATGEAVLGSRGQITSLRRVRIEPTPWPAWAAPSLTDVDLSSAAPPTTGIDGVDDDEVAAFLALIRG